jgi:cysteine-rich repeat protein
MANRTLTLALVPLTVFVAAAIPLSHIEAARERPVPPPGIKCGDGIVYVPTEQCDDGNRKNKDGCSAACQWEAPPANVCFSDYQCKRGKICSTSLGACDSICKGPLCPAVCGGKCVKPPVYQCGNLICEPGEADTVVGVTGCYPNPDLPEPIDGTPVKPGPACGAPSLIAPGTCPQDCGRSTGGGTCGDGICENRQGYRESLYGCDPPAEHPEACAGHILCQADCGGQGQPEPA